MNKVTLIGDMISIEFMNTKESNIFPEVDQV